MEANERLDSKGQVGFCGRKILTEVTQLSDHVTAGGSGEG